MADRSFLCIPEFSPPLLQTPGHAHLCLKKHSHSLPVVYIAAILNWQFLRESTSSSVINMLKKSSLLKPTITMTCNIQLTQPSTKNTVYPNLLTWFGSKNGAAHSDRFPTPVTFVDNFKKYYYEIFAHVRKPFLCQY